MLKSLALKLIRKWRARATQLLFGQVLADIKYIIENQSLVVFKATVYH